MTSIVKILFNRTLRHFVQSEVRLSIYCKETQGKKIIQEDNLCNEMSHRKSNKLPTHSGITSRDLQMSKLLNRRLHCCALIAINIMRVLRNMLRSFGRVIFLRSESMNGHELRPNSLCDVCLGVCVYVCVAHEF